MLNAFSISASATARPALKLTSLKTSTRKVMSPMAAMGGSGSGGNNNNRGGGGGGGGGDDSNSEQPGRKFTLSRAALAAGTLALSTMPTSANAGKPKIEDVKKGMQIAGLEAGDFAALFATELGISGAVGLGVGIMAKAAAKTALMVLAAIYAFIRWLELNDIVDVKWQNLSRLVGKTAMMADLNNDGKVDAKDLKLAKAKAVGFFGSAVPSASGLAAGIAIGLKL